MLLPFDLVSDLNNDGKIGSTDSQLKKAAYADGASDDDIEKGTEYLFVNDNISNGLWDKDDTADPSKPASATDDDDVECFNVTCAATRGAIWFEHPAIGKLAFYKTKKCADGDKLTFPFVLSDTNKLPDKIYIRAEGEFDAQVDGDLVMKFGTVDKATVWASEKEKFTIVRQFGDAKYFQAARNYIMENNTRFYTCIRKYTSSKWMSLVVMREEAMSMTALDTYWRTPRLFGIGEVVGAYNGASVVINANMTFDKHFIAANKVLTAKCQGRLVSGGSLNTNVSSDNDDKSVPWPDNPLNPQRGSELAGPTGKYVAMVNNKFVFAKGRVPVSPAPQEAMGGLSTNYGRDNQPQMIGDAPVDKTNRVLFTATPYLTSTGMTQLFSADAQKSGVQALPGGSAGELMLFKLDGGTSLALAYKNPDDALSIRIKGSKHDPDPTHYCVNTYLMFMCNKPR